MNKLKDLKLKNQLIISTYIMAFILLIFKPTLITSIFNRLITAFKPFIIGGIIAFLILIYIYYIDLKRCSKLWSNRVAQIFTFGIFAYSIMGITEVFEYPLMYLILLLPYYSYEIINQSKISENNILNKKFKIK